MELVGPEDATFPVTEDASVQGPALKSVTCEGNSLGFRGWQVQEKLFSSRK